MPRHVLALVVSSVFPCENFTVNALSLGNQMTMRQLQQTDSSVKNVHVFWCYSFLFHFIIPHIMIHILRVSNSAANEIATSDGARQPHLSEPTNQLALGGKLTRLYVCITVNVVEKYPKEDSLPQFG